MKLYYFFSCINLSVVIPLSTVKKFRTSDHHPKLKWELDVFSISQDQSTCLISYAFLIICLITWAHRKLTCAIYYWSLNAHYLDCYLIRINKNVFLPHIQNLILIYFKSFDLPGFPRVFATLTDWLHYSVRILMFENVK